MEPFNNFLHLIGRFSYLRLLNSGLIDLFANIGTCRSFLIVPFKPREKVFKARIMLWISLTCFCSKEGLDLGSLSLCVKPTLSPGALSIELVLILVKLVLIGLCLRVIINL